MKLRVFQHSWWIFENVVGGIGRFFEDAWKTISGIFSKMGSFFRTVGSF